ncbi:2218_t:CDS:2 [Rhizophagus irregularis]|nr:2218_t:CDS:2 [Rhizophagus irregularis]
MNVFLTAKSENEIDSLFDKIQTAEENMSDWISFYRQKWVIGS